MKYRCPKHDISMEVRGGCSAHRVNWYCPECDKDSVNTDTTKPESVEENTDRYYKQWDDNDFWLIVDRTGEIVYRQIFYFEDEVDSIVAALNSLSTPKVDTDKVSISRSVVGHAIADIEHIYQEPDFEDLDVTKNPNWIELSTALTQGN